MTATADSQSKTKHTPGPLFTLRATKLSDGGTDHAVMATINGKQRCIGEAFEVVDTGVRVPAEANARLWAAAPDLLAELKQMRLLFQSALLCTTVEIAREAKPFLNSSAAAIAKAEGR